MICSNKLIKLTITLYAVADASLEMHFGDLNDRVQGVQKL